MARDAEQRFQVARPILDTLGLQRDDNEAAPAAVIAVDGAPVEQVLLPAIAQHDRPRWRRRLKADRPEPVQVGLGRGNRPVGRNDPRKASHAGLGDSPPRPVDLVDLGVFSQADLAARAHPGRSRAWDLVATRETVLHVGRRRIPLAARRRAVKTPVRPLAGAPARDRHQVRNGDDPDIGNRWHGHFSPGRNPRLTPRQPRPLPPPPQPPRIPIGHLEIPLVPLVDPRQAAEIIRRPPAEIRLRPQDGGFRHRVHCRP